MTSRERVLNAYYKKGYDRIPVKHEGTPEVNKMLMEHFGLDNHEQLLRVIGDDFRYVNALYIGPKLRTFSDGSVEGYWGERYRYVKFEKGTYLEAVYLPYADINELKDLDRSKFPSANSFDYSTIKKQCEKINGEFAVCFGSAGDMDFINSISRARGMEQVLMDLIDGNEVFLDIMEHRFNFYYEMHKNALEAANGLIEFTHIGEDLGNQIAPMISMEIFEKYFAQKYKKYFEMAHSYGAKVMMHMCGTVDVFLPRLIELGLDVQDVVQPTTPDMDIAVLKEKFGEQLVFQGSMDVQKEIAFGNPEEVRREVRKRLDLFPKGGLFFGPSHAIQAGSPLENILTMYKEAGSLTEDVGNDILSIVDESNDDDMIDMSKLF